MKLSYCIAAAIIAWFVVVTILFIVGLLILKLTY